MPSPSKSLINRPRGQPRLLEASIFFYRSSHSWRWSTEVSSPYGCSIALHLVSTVSCDWIWTLDLSHFKSSSLDQLCRRSANWHQACDHCWADSNRDKPEFSFRCKNFSSPESSRPGTNSIKPWFLSNEGVTTDPCYCHEKLLSRAVACRDRGLWLNLSSFYAFLLSFGHQMVGLTENVLIKKNISYAA